MYKVKEGTLYALDDFKFAATFFCLYHLHCIAFHSKAYLLTLKKSFKSGLAN